MHSRFKRFMSIILLTLIFIQLLPMEAKAHEAYFLQVLIDRDEMVYMPNVIEDSPSAEAKHIEHELGDFKKIGSLEYGDYSVYDKGILSEVGFLPFTFPAKAIYSEDETPSEHNRVSAINDAGSKDRDRALAIGNSLVGNLNEILNLINDGERYDSIESLISASERIIQAEKSGSSNYNGWSLRTKGDYMYVKKSGGNEYEYRYRMKKGYNSPTLDDGEFAPLYIPGVYDDDISRISMGMLAIQANYTYKEKGHTTFHVDEYNKPGTITKRLNEMFANLVNSLYSLLGLYNLNELIYSEGVRGTNGFYGGIMSLNWMSNAMTFHMIFQAIAWILLVVAIVKLLFQRNLATINPQARVSLIDGVKNLLLTGFALIASFVVINTLIKLNSKIVDIFGSTTPSYSVIDGQGAGSKTSAGVLMSLFYLFITAYMNFIYIVRAITLVVLIAAAPIFILTIAFGERSKQIFNTWSKELVGNIFLQSFHAFILSIFLNIQVSSRGIELAILSMSLIPMTSFFRSLFLGNSGGFVGRVGGQAVSTATTAVAGFAGGALGAARGVLTGESKGGGMVGGVGNKVKSSIPGMNRNQERREHSADGDIKTYDSEEAIGKMEIPGGIESTEGSSEVSSGEVTSKEGDSYERLKRGGLGRGVSGRDVAGNIASAGLGLAGAAVTGASMVALGGNAGTARVMGQGIAHSVGQGGKGAKGAYKMAEPTIEKVRKDTLSIGKDEEVEKSGNIIGAETLDNGNTVIHRDRKMVNQDGLIDAKRTEDGDFALTYDESSLSNKHIANLNKIKEASRSGDDEYLYQRGIENVTKNNDGDTVITYNQHGASQLGFSDIYQTRDRIVETKSPGQELGTNLTYNIEDIEEIPQRGLN